MKRVVAITGASGFLGHHLTVNALKAGWEVRAVVRNPKKAEPLRELGAQIHKADLGEPEAMSEAFDGCDAVISNAALGSWQGELAAYMKVNVQGAQNVMDAVCAAKVGRVVWISSVAVYRTRLWKAMDEDTDGYDTAKRRFNWTDLTTDWRYSRTKTLAEDLAWTHAKTSGVSLTCLRVGPLYGSKDPKLTQRYLRAASRKVVFAPTVGVPQVHAEDVALAAVKALSTAESEGKSYNLAGEPTSPYQVHHTLKRLRGHGPTIFPVPLPLSVRYDCSRAQRDLDFSSRSLESGLREVLDAQ